MSGALCSGSGRLARPGMGRAVCPVCHGTSTAGLDPQARWRKGTIVPDHEPPGEAVKHSVAWVGEIPGYQCQRRSCAHALYKHRESAEYRRLNPRERGTGCTESGCQCKQAEVTG